MPISTGSRIRPSSPSSASIRSATMRVLIVEWPEHAGPDAWPDALRLTLDITGPEQRRLTAEVPAAWEGRWPPPELDHDPARRRRCLPRRLRLGRGADRAARRRCLVPPLFPGDRRRTPGGADGRAAAARGPAAVHRGRRMAGLGRPDRARNHRPRPRSRAAPARRFRRRPAARDARRRSADARPISTASPPICWSSSTATRRCPACRPTASTSGSTN